MDNTTQSDLIRRLTQAILVSGGINIILLSLLFYFLIKETPPQPYCELKPATQNEQQAPLASDQGNGEFIRSLRILPMERLLVKLSNTQLVENGYTQRDLALAALVTFHHFDLPRALLGQPQPTQQRKIPFGRNRKGELVEVVVYPGLTEQQYMAINNYANTERWPLNSQGLFTLLRKKKGLHDPSLADAFFLTPEFLAVETLFNRSEAHVERPELLQLLCSGKWELLTAFTEQQRAAQDLSPARRQRLLLDYIGQGSQAAAYMLLKTDGIFAALKLDDEHILSVLRLLTIKTPESEQFALMLLTSPRGDDVWQMAAGRLYEFSGEPKPEEYIHHAALARFIPQAITAPNKTSGPIAAPVMSTPVPLQSKSLAKSSSIKTPKPTPEVLQTPAPSSAMTKRERMMIVEKSEKTKSVNARPLTTVTKAKTNPAKVKRIGKGRPYIVQEGDSLWKIARKYKVDIDILKAHNRLQSDFLKPGTTLMIP